MGNDHDLCLFDHALWFIVLLRPIIRHNRLSMGDFFMPAKDTLNVKKNYSYELSKFDMTFLL